MTEPDSRYWPPPIDDESLNKYVEDYKRQGIYPPKLNTMEKEIIDRSGTYDNKGNKHSVVWTLGGHPIATKIDKNGNEFSDNNNTGKYTRQVGCWNIEVLDD